MVRRRQAGFTYLTALFVVALLLGGLALVGEVWETAARRDKEAQLLFAGNQYRTAIRRYYDATPGPAKRYPATLQELVNDTRHPAVQRHLRRLYADPLGDGWGLVRGPDGGIRGVHSLSQAEPLKTAGFAARDAGFESARRYADWKFIHAPLVAPRAPRTQR